MGDQAPAFFTALAQRDIGLRLNTLRGSVPDLIAKLPWQTEAIPWCAEGRLLVEDAAYGTHPYHTAGVYYSQDPSAMAAAVILDPQPGEWILDLAAAPGGKGTHIAARMQNEGLLVANDTSRRRTSVLSMNLERMGVLNAMVTNETPERLASRWPGLFDAVLVDAPCSGEGMFSRDPRAMQEWSLDSVASYANVQAAIMAEAAKLLHPGGRLLYGTCTFSPEENEAVIAAFLDAHPDFEVVNIHHIPGITPGRPEWIAAPPSVSNTGRFFPHTGPGHGHYYALLRHTGDVPSDLPGLWQGSALPGRVHKLLRSTMDEVLREALLQEGLWLNKNDDIYRLFMEPHMLEGLRVMRPGLWLASLRHNKIMLDHALAMGVNADSVNRQFDLAVDDPRVQTYLDGSSWMDASENGWVWVSVDGFPLGWAKVAGGRFRSRYPVHLRKT